MKTCRTCEVEKPRSEFYKHPGSRDGLRGDCKACRTSANLTYRASRYAEYRAWINGLKTATGCVDCGFKAVAEELHYDHLDPLSKRFSISNGWQYSRCRVEQEIAQCAVRCLRCHAARTARQKRDGSAFDGIEAVRRSRRAPVTV